MRRPRGSPAGPSGETVERGINCKPKAGRLTLRAMTVAPSAELLADLASRLGPRGFTRDPREMEPWLDDWRGRYHGAAAAMLSPQSTAEVAEIVRLCAAANVALVPQGGNTSMVGGATPGPAGDSILLSLRRMNRIRSISAASNSAVCEAGV